MCYADYLFKLQSYSDQVCNPKDHISIYGEDLSGKILLEGLV